MRGHRTRAFRSRTRWARMGRSRDHMPCTPFCSTPSSTATVSSCHACRAAATLALACRMPPLMLPRRCHVAAAALLLITAPHGTCRSQQHLQAMSTAQFGFLTPSAVPHTDVVRRRTRAWVGRGTPVTAALTRVASMLRRAGLTGALLSTADLCVAVVQVAQTTRCRSSTSSPASLRRRSRGTRRRSRPSRLRGRAFSSRAAPTAACDAGTARTPARAARGCSSSRTLSPTQSSPCAPPPPPLLPPPPLPTSVCLWTRDPCHSRVVGLCPHLAVHEVVQRRGRPTPHRRYLVARRRGCF